MKNKVLSVSQLDVNQGQIDGVPSNPRWWAREELDNLKKSLIETPELFNARGCIVFPYEGRYVVVGGNMRYVAAKELGLDVPCHVLDADLNVEKLKEIVIKDNASMGTWDDSLSEWDIPNHWGVEKTEWKRDEDSPRAHLPKDNKCEISVQFTPEEFLFVQKRLEEYGETKEEGLLFLLNYGRE